MAPLYAGFAATGVGVALPGAVLPVLAAQWKMNDAASGRLFLMAWIGSSIGALFVRGPLRRTLLLASFTIALAAAGLGLSTGHHAGLWMLLYGCGLGAAMTSISLIRQRQAHDVGTEFVRLNLVWAIGALAAPSLAASALAGGSVRPVFWSLAALFTLLALWSVSLPALRPDRRNHASDPPPWRVFRAVPLGLIIMIALATGIEAAAGGWLATYARRDGYRLAETIAAPTCLWAGLLLSRLFWSIFSRWQRPYVTVRGSTLLMAASTLLLLTSQHGVFILLAAFGLGFGLGPTYPLLLAWALRFQRGGAIFFLAGVSSASLPWLTGVLSNAQGSLRFGLGVPCAGALLMLVLAWTLPLRLWRMNEDA
jgi:FHS family glucose/mannose:H+ symporter-like MFS transporter